MHCFRRAASRLISSTASTPARSSWALAPRSSRAALLPRFPQPLSQYRWNSNDASNQPEPPKQDAAEENETSNEQMIDAAVQYVEEGAVRTNEIADQVGESLEEKKPLPRAAGPQIYEWAKDKPRRERRLKALKNTPEPKETVFIGNLFYDVTADDLRTQMEKYGIVERVLIVFDNRGISRGFGYVQFDSIESAKRAIDAMDGRVFEGRVSVVEFALNNIENQKQLQPASKSLYIGNLSYEMTDRDLNLLFKDIVNVIDVRVAIDRRTGQTRGFAHADFTNIESARAAQEILSKKAPYGRKLRIDYSFSEKVGEKRERKGKKQDENEPVLD